jgi:hypothetical protein
MKKAVFIFTLLLMYKLGVGQEVNDLVIINLKSGFPVKGKISEIIPNEYLKIKLMNDEVLKVLYSEVNNILIDQKENKIKKNEKIKVEKIKAAEQQRKNDSLIKVQNRIKYETLVNEFQLYNYIYLNAGISSLSADKKVVENIVLGSNTIEQFPINNSSQFNGFNVGIEYLFNFNKRKNLSLIVDFSQVKSSILVPYANLDFINSAATLNLGHCFYQKSVKASFGTGISIIQNQIITSIEGRQNILCGTINYFSVPFFFQIRYPSNRKFSVWFKPNLNINLINSNIIPTYSLNAGMSLLKLRKNKN